MNFDKEYLPLLRPVFLQQVSGGTPDDAAERFLQNHLLAFEYHGSCESPAPAAWNRSIRENLKRNLAQAALIRRLVSLLQEHSVPYVILKGLPLATRSQQNIALRVMKDVDLLVSEPDTKAVDSLLVKTFGAQVKDGCITARIRDSNEMVYQADGLIIELHWRPAPCTATFPVLDINQPGVTEKCSDVYGDVNVLSLPYEMAYQTYHGGKHMWYRIRWLLDWYRLQEQVSDQDAQDVYGLITEMGQEKLFAPACELCEIITGRRLEKWSFAYGGRKTRRDHIAVIPENA